MRKRAAGVYNKTMKYNKLVRDDIPAYIRTKGGTPVYHVASESEYWEKLKEKLSEELKEFTDAESAEEFADLLEVMDAVADYKGFDRERIQAIRKQKADERGVFRKRIILDES